MNALELAVKEIENLNITIHVSVSSEEADTLDSFCKVVSTLDDARSSGDLATMRAGLSAVHQVYQAVTRGSSSAASESHWQAILSRMPFEGGSVLRLEDRTKGRQELSFCLDLNETVYIGNWMSLESESQEMLCTLVNVRAKGQAWELIISDGDREKRISFEHDLPGLPWTVSPVLSESFEAVSVSEFLEKLSNRGSVENDSTIVIFTADSNAICQSCGAELNKDWEFCADCGARNAARLSPTERICPNPKCGQVMPSAKRFCYTCGTRLV